MNYETWRATFQNSEQAAKAAYKELKAAYAQNAEPVHQFQPESMDEGWIDCNERDLKIYQQDGHWPTRTLYTKPHITVPEAWIPALEWAVKRCQALQDQGFDGVRLDVLEKTFSNAIEAHRPKPPQQGGSE